MKRIKLTRRKKGLSSVVGAVFLVLVMLAGFNLIVWSIQQQDGYSLSLIDRSMEDWRRMSERVEISSVQIDQNRFNLTVLNKGSLTAHIVRLWVTNDSATPRWHDRRDTDIYINPSEVVTNIGQQLDISADSSNRYSLKLVTERGNTAEFKIIPDINARVELIIPAGVLMGAKFTVMFIVVNNATFSNNMLNVTPTLSYSGGATLESGPSPSSVAVLKDASTAVFTWAFKAPTQTGTLIFNASFVGAPSGVYSNSTVEVFKASEAEGAGTAVFASAAKRLGILISGVPNPVDTSGGKWGKWGVGVVNPLNRTIEIYAVAISSPNSKITSGIVGNRPATGWEVIAPTSGSNIIYWQGDSPIIIPSYSVYDFRVEVEGKFASIKETPIFIEALTSEGKYVLTYLTTQGGGEPLINLFYTSNPSNPNSDWKWAINNVPGGVPRTFNVTVQNNGGTLTSYIKLLIIVPEDWTDVTASSSQTGWQTPTVASNPDGSALISVDTSATQINEGDILVFQFTATPPITTGGVIFVLTTTTVYPQWTGVRVSSAISETAVQVVPN